MALGTNLPFRWLNSDTFAASLYVGVADHHAIRGNVAWYKNHDSVGETIGGLEGGDSLGHTGQIVDLGISWVYYPERRWQGFTLEAGALRRAHRISTFDPDAQAQEVDQDTTTYAVRGMLGWSWLISRVFFISTGAGVSIGHETGTERKHFDSTEMVTSSHVARQAVSGEAYLRIGLVFGP